MLFFIEIIFLETKKSSHFKDSIISNRLTLES